MPFAILPALILATAVAPAGSLQRVEVVLSNFKFAPASIHLKAGAPVTLHLVNQASGGHNFAAPEFFRAATIDPASARSVAKGAVELKKGQTLDIRLTPRAGHYALRCTHFLHTGFGMKGEVVVD